MIIWVASLSHFTFLIKMANSLRRALTILDHVSFFLPQKRIVSLRCDYLNLGQLILMIFRFIHFKFNGMVQPLVLSYIHQKARMKNGL